jgi:hypothetical protein
MRTSTVHLDRPLLLCQEIYTRLIGNHQTAIVSKERVIELLKQDNAQHIKDHPDEFEGDTSVDPIITMQGELLHGEALNLRKGVEESKVEGQKQDDGDSDVEDGADKKQPLVGYWNWEHTLRTQKMKMHLAKGTDLALHVVVAILVNQVRYERNAVALTM